jgi:xanthine dehydrogenase iron-sulfur cluster and FAD-binding subunit A
MASTFEVHEVQRQGRPIASVVRPASIVGALRALAAEPDARPLAGGTDLLLELQRGGPGEAVTVVDLTTIDRFREIENRGDHWRLSGGVTHGQIVRHAGIRTSALPLAQACLEIGSPQLRNRATIAGNLATASPANDTISALIALDASVEIGGLLNGDASFREVRVDEFFTGFRQTALHQGELITAILVPKLAANERGIWVKLGLRRAQAISVVHAGIVVGFDDEVVKSARLALGSVAPTVVLVDEFSQALVGSTLNDLTISSASEAAANAVAPITDGRATAEYRSETISVLVARSLRAISKNAVADTWPDDPPTLSSDAQLVAVAPGGDTTRHAESSITVTVNGVEVTGSGPTMTLLDWVRDEAGSTGMKEGCAEGECGACTMLLDGAAVMSCLVTAAQADGRSVSTVEGLSHPIQQAFVDDFAVQCGFCIPGFLMSGARLIEEHDDPTDEQIQLALSGNLCRCTGYYPIIQAVKDAAVTVRGQHD